MRLFSKLLVMHQVAEAEIKPNEAEDNSGIDELAMESGHVELDAENKELRRSQWKRITNTAFKDYVW